MTEDTKTTRIHREMTIESILSSFPSKAQKITQELTNTGLHCVGCHAATWETLEAGMYGHGMNDEQIDALVKRLNAILDEESNPDTITLTPRAAKKFQALCEAEGKSGWGIRFMEKMAGCNGFEYTLDYDEKAKEADQIFQSEGVDIFIDKADVPRLLGVEIDYVDGLQGQGFKISNPNARSSCGCGSSHGY